MAERLKQLHYTNKFPGEPSCKVLVSPGQACELQQDVSMGRGQLGVHKKGQHLASSKVEAMVRQLIVVRPWCITLSSQVALLNKQGLSLRVFSNLCSFAATE